MNVIEKLAPFCPNASCVKTPVLQAAVEELDEQECYKLSRVDAKGKRRQYYHFEAKKIHFVLDKALRINWSKDSQTFGTWQVKELLQAQFGDFDEISELRASKSKRATSSTSSRPSPRAVLAGDRELETTAGQIGPFRSYPGSEEPSETEDLFGSEFDVESDTGTPKAMPAVAAPLVDMSPARSISDPKPVDVKEVSEEDSECEIVDVKEASEEEKRAREMVLSALGQMARTSIC